MKNFWEKLPKPFFCLAPMADVTDAPFRQIIAKYGKPDIFWTEFVSADGLASPGREVLKNNLIFTKKERPIVAQLFSSHPDKMRIASKYVASLGFDGIDINMGCPDKSIEKQGAGAAMMKDMKRAGEIIQAVKDGIKDYQESYSKRRTRSIPVSVKTRIGYNKNQISEWIPFLLSQDISALTIHARTRKEMSDVPARWEHVKEVVEIRNKMKVKTKIIGNGDVVSIAQGEKLAEETDCDGIMIGRGIFGNPWLFSRRPLRSSDHLLTGAVHLSHFDYKNAQGLALGSLSQVHPLAGEEVRIKLKVMLEHTKLFESILGNHKSFSVMKKHFKAYVNGFDGARELRVKLMETKNYKEVKLIITRFLKN